MTTVTQWFGMDTPPVNPGVYEVTPKDFFTKKWWSRWDCKEWKTVTHCLNVAARAQTRSLSCYVLTETDRWRGLAEKSQ